MIYKGLLLFVFMEYVRPGTIYPPIAALRISFVIFWGVMLGGILTKGGRTNAEVLSHPNMRILLILLSLITVSVLTADVTLYSYIKWRAVSEYMLVTWVIIKHVTTLKRLKGLFLALIAVHIAVAILTPSLMFSGTRQYLASGSFLGDSNDFALSVNIVIPLCLFLLADETKWRNRIFYLGVLGFLVFLVVATQSRGGTVALVVTGVYYWLTSQQKIRTAVLVAAAVGLIFLFAPPAYFDRMHTIESDEGSAQGRIMAWKAGMRMASDHPLLGVGAGHFAVAYGTLYRTQNIPWQTAHSIYFLALGELGYPGAATLLLFLFWNLMANFRDGRLIKDRLGGQPSSAARLVACVNVSLLAYATGGIFLSALYYPHIFILAGVLASARYIAHRTVEVEPRVVTGSPSTFVPPQLRLQPRPSGGGAA